jgi:membrane protein YqaA with SNARE-associated domain
MFYKALTVAFLASFELYAAIPAGYTFKLDTWVIFVSSLIGGVAGVFVATFLGDRIKKLILKYKKPAPPKPEKTDTLAHKIWNKYGVIGLGVIGTFAVGAPISIAVGVGLNAPLKKLITYCCIGIFIRCLVFTFAGHFVKELLEKYF